MTNAMNAIMQQDDDVDQTPDFGIMAGYAKAKVWNSYKESVGARKALDHRLGKELEGVLETGAPQSMLWPMTALAREGWFAASFVNSLPEDETIVFALWESFTKDDVDQERKLEVARQWYKDRLSGCIGVQPSGILRANLKDYSGVDADEFPSYDDYRSEN